MIGKTFLGMKCLKNLLRFFKDERVNSWEVKDNNEKLTISENLSNKYINGDSDFSWIFP